MPRVGRGDDLGGLVREGLQRAELTLEDGDVLVVTSKVLSCIEGRWVDLSTVEPSARARQLSAQLDKEAPLVELILRESSAISRQAPGVLIVRHRLGFVSANAGIDCSNALPDGAPAGSGPWALLLPRSPDESARALRAELQPPGASIGVVISDSHGRPFRFGTVGMAIGAAGLPALVDHVGRQDLDGRPLEVTVTGLADQVAAAADMVAGQGDEGRPVVHLRGLSFAGHDSSAAQLQRPADRDLYA